MADTSNASRDPRDIKIEALSEALTESRIRNEVLATAYGQISIMLVRSFDDAAGVRRTSAGTYQRIAELEAELTQAKADEIKLDRLYDGLQCKLHDAGTGVGMMMKPTPTGAEIVDHLVFMICQLKAELDFRYQDVSKLADIRRSVDEAIEAAGLTEHVADPQYNCSRHDALFILAAAYRRAIEGVQAVPAQRPAPDHFIRTTDGTEFAISRSDFDYFVRMPGAFRTIAGHPQALRISESGECSHVPMLLAAVAGAASHG